MCHKIVSCTWFRLFFIVLFVCCTNKAFDRLLMKSRACTHIAVSVHLNGWMNRAMAANITPDFHMPSNYNYITSAQLIQWLQNECVSGFLFPPLFFGAFIVPNKSGLGWQWHKLWRIVITFKCTGCIADHFFNFKQLLSAFIGIPLLTTSQISSDFEKWPLHSLLF